MSHVILQVDILRRMQGREEALKLVAVFEVCIAADLQMPKQILIVGKGFVLSLSYNLFAVPLQDDEQAYVITEVCYGGTLEQFMRVSTTGILHILTFCN